MCHCNRRLLYLALPLQHAPALVGLPVGDGGGEVVDEDVPRLEAREEPLGRGLVMGGNLITIWGVPSFARF